MAEAAHFRRILGTTCTVVAGMAILAFSIVEVHAHSQGATATHPGVITSPSVTYKTYHNSRFGFTIDCPSSWTPGPQPTNGDGMSWYMNAKAPTFKNTVSPEHAKDVELVAIGVPNVTMGIGVGQNFQQMLSMVEDTIIPSLKKETGMMLVQHGVSDGWIWITSIQNIGDHATMYSKQYINLSTIETMQFSFPSDQKNTYEPILSRIEQSFHPGNGHSK
jgi:hypothetical protein